MSGLSFLYWSDSDTVQNVEERLKEQVYLINEQGKGKDDSDKGDTTCYKDGKKQTNEDKNKNGWYEAHIITLQLYKTLL